MVEILLRTDRGERVALSLGDKALHAPAHMEVEVLSAIGRLVRADAIDEDRVEQMLTALASTPLKRHQVTDLLVGAWQKRHNLRLADGLYVELAERLNCRLMTTDTGLSRSTPLALLIPD